MPDSIHSIRGFNDILPDQTPHWLRLEQVVRDVMAAYGYAQIRLPLLEKTELFRRAIGEVTDIVEKEMYAFEDRNGDSLTLRPEGTAGCARAAMQAGLIPNQIHKLWYAGPMFRHERPQRGRYRQFHQIGVEVYGLEGPDVDAELLLLSARIWRALRLEDVRLEINSLATIEARQAYRERLTAYFRDHHAALDEDSVRRLESNPLRILDSKNPDMAKVIADAPVLLDHLDAASAEHFARLKARLDDAGVAYQVNPRLVRGLDYYTRSVFEWITDRLGAQGAICAGGRYDGLTTQLGGKAVPAVGFAMGMERLVELLRETNQTRPPPAPHAYLIAPGEPAQRAALQLAETLRDALPGLRLLVHHGGGGFKSQFKKADKSGALWALVLGEDERARNEIQIKPLRRDGEPQRTVSQTTLAEELQSLVHNA